MAGPSPAAPSPSGGQTGPTYSLAQAKAIGLMAVRAGESTVASAARAALGFQSEEWQAAADAAATFRDAVVAAHLLLDSQTMDPVARAHARAQITSVNAFTQAMQARATANHNRISQATHSAPLNS